MTYSIDPQTLFFAALALIIGLVLGWLVRGNKARRIAGLQSQVANLTGERDAVVAERDRLLTDLDTARAQIRPLSDEVDRLRRAAAKRDALAAPAAGTLLDTAAADPAAAPVLATQSDDLMQLKGVGDKFAAKLQTLGITQIRQIAAWSSADVAVIDSQLGPFQGRIMRDRLVEQAKLLNEGRLTEYETRFGKLGDPAV